MAKNIKKRMRSKKISPGLKQIRRTPGLSVQIAAKLKISRQAVSDWDKVPVGRIAAVERITGISRDKLRPDIYIFRR